MAVQWRSQKYLEWGGSKIFTKFLYFFIFLFFVFSFCSVRELVGGRGLVFLIFFRVPYSRMGIRHSQWGFASPFSNFFTGNFYNYLPKGVLNEPRLPEPPNPCPCLRHCCCSHTKRSPRASLTNQCLPPGRRLFPFIQTPVHRKAIDNT